MLFENVSQYQKAKQTLIENDLNINKSALELKKSPLFNNLSEGEIICNLTELKEGLGDSLLNFLSDSFGGDINKLKTVLTQMKEQELKFNREEYDIYNQFYRLLQDQKALDKDKKNPDYQNLSRDLQSSRNALNIRFKELTKSHDEILNALEERVRDLTKDSNRKKKYFNAQRAIDVQETRNDRYEKQKAITAKSSVRTKELEDFFNFNIDDTKKQAEEAEETARKEAERIKKMEEEARKKARKIGVYDQEPEKSFYDELKSIQSTPGGYYAKIKELKDLDSAVYKEIIKNNKSVTTSEPFGDLGEAGVNNLYEISKEIEKEIKKIEAKKSGTTT